MKPGRYTDLTTPAVLITVAGPNVIPRDCAFESPDSRSCLGRWLPASTFPEHRDKFGHDGDVACIVCGKNDRLIVRVGRRKHNS